MKRVKGGHATRSGAEGVCEAFDSGIE